MQPWPETARLIRRATRFAALLVGMVCAAAASGAGAADVPAGLKPYTARYQASYRSISGGQIEMALARGARPGEWSYQTRAFPNLLGRVAVSPQARERSTMLVQPGKVQPLRFDFDDGSSSMAKDVRFTFDWTAGSVRGEAEGQAFELPVEPGTQDTPSVQAAMMLALLEGRAPQGFTILTGHRLRYYRYWPEGRARVVTPYGQFDTVVWANQRDGSTRVTKVWHAPELGYVPVQAIQYRKGQAETQMKLVALER